MRGTGLLRSKKGILMHELRQSNRTHIFAQDIYHGYGDKLVLDNVDFCVRRGDFVSFVGPSGCGKSTFLRLALGQEIPNRGILEIDRRPAGFADTRRGIVYQKYSLFPHLTVFGNVMLGLDLRHPLGRRIFGRKELKAEVYQMLEQMRLTDAINKYPGQLSGGMQQRVAIAQALILKPEVLLMDEPFGALDPGTREQMQVLLLELWEKHKLTILFVTHDLVEAVFLGTRIAVLSQYYDDDRDPTCQRGSRIVYDRHLDSRAMSTKVKESPQFTGIVEEAKEVGFNPKHRLHIAKFNLTHPDSFRTLRPEELKKK